MLSGLLTVDLYTINTKKMICFVKCQEKIAFNSFANASMHLPLLIIEMLFFLKKGDVDDGIVAFARSRLTGNAHKNDQHLLVGKRSTCHGANEDQMTMI